MKKLVFLVLIQFLLSQNLFSQYYFYVSPSNDKAKPNLNERGVSNDEALNQIFKEFEVMHYYQSFPGAKNPELLKFYEIHLAENRENKDFDTFESSLKNSKAFDAIYRSVYYVPACSNPITTNDPFVSTNKDALNMLDAECAWSITTGDPDIIVGVAERYFETDHEDLENSFAGFIGTYAGMMPSDHGTKVAGCVAATPNNNKGIAGIGYNTKINGCYVEYYNVQSNNLWHVIWNAHLDGIKIINVSFDSNSKTPPPPSCPTIPLAVKEMTDNGVVLVVAAGNEPDVTSHKEYADIPGVINVSGVDANNRHGGTRNQKGELFAHNSWVDVCALSMGVAVCTFGNTYGLGNGTSYAAPQVAGVVALMRSVNPNLTPAEVESIIKSTTDQIADAHLFPGLLGTGRVNAYKAVLAVKTACEAATVNFTNQIVSTNTTVTSLGNIYVQDVIVTNGAKLTLDAACEILLDTNVEVEPGAELEIIK